MVFTKILTLKDNFGLKKVTLASEYHLFRKIYLINILQKYLTCSIYYLKNVTFLNNFFVNVYPLLLASILIWTHDLYSHQRCHANSVH